MSGLYTCPTPFIGKDSNMFTISDGNLLVSDLSKGVNRIKTDVVFPFELEDGSSYFVPAFVVLEDSRLFCFQIYKDKGTSKLVEATPGVPCDESTSPVHVLALSSSLIGVLSASTCMRYAVACVCDPVDINSQRLCVVDGRYSKTIRDIPGFWMDRRFHQPVSGCLVEWDSPESFIFASLNPVGWHAIQTQTLFMSNAEGQVLHEIDIRGIALCRAMREFRVSLSSCMDSGSCMLPGLSHAQSIYYDRVNKTLVTANAQHPDMFAFQLQKNGEPRYVDRLCTDSFSVFRPLSVVYDPVSMNIVMTDPKSTGFGDTTERKIFFQHRRARSSFLLCLMHGEPLEETLVSVNEEDGDGDDDDKSEQEIPEIQGTCLFSVKPYRIHGPCIATIESVYGFLSVVGEMQTTPVTRSRSKSNDSGWCVDFNPMGPREIHVLPDQRLFWKHEPISTMSREDFIRSGVRVSLSRVSKLLCGCCFGNSVKIDDYAVSSNRLCKRTRALVCHEEDCSYLQIQGSFLRLRIGHTERGLITTTVTPYFGGEIAYRIWPSIDASINNIKQFSAPKFAMIGQDTGSGVHVFSIISVERSSTTRPAPGENNKKRLRSEPFFDYFLCVFVIPSRLEPDVSSIRLGYLCSGSIMYRPDACGSPCILNQGKLEGKEFLCILPCVPGERPYCELATVSLADMTQGVDAKRAMDAGCVLSKSRLRVRSPTGAVLDSVKKTGCQHGAIVFTSFVETGKNLEARSVELTALGANFDCILR